MDGYSTRRSTLFGLAILVGLTILWTAVMCLMVLA